MKTNFTYTLGAAFENLTLLGSANLNGIGNPVNNLIVGNSGNNVLDGGLGSDSLIGGGEWTRSRLRRAREYPDFRI